MSPKSHHKLVSRIGPKTRPVKKRSYGGRRRQRLVSGTSKADPGGSPRPQRSSEESCSRQESEPRQPWLHITLNMMSQASAADITVTSGRFHPSLVSPSSPSLPSSSISLPCPFPSPALPRGPQWSVGGLRARQGRGVGGSLSPSDLRCREMDVAYPSVSPAKITFFLFSKFNPRRLFSRLGSDCLSTQYWLLFRSRIICIWRTLW